MCPKVLFNTKFCFKIVKIFRIFYTKLSDFLFVNSDKNGRILYKAW